MSVPRIPNGDEWCGTAFPGERRGGVCRQGGEGVREGAALAEETGDGEPSKGYAYTAAKTEKSDANTWISVTTGLPIQIESTGSFMGHSATTRVRYSNFDDPSIKIDAPN